MKRFSRILSAVALTSAAALALSGCTSGGGSESGADGGATGDAKGAVAMSFAGLDIQIWNDMLPFMETIVTDAGYEFVTDDPKWNAQTQVQDWESWIVRGDIKAIMGYPVPVSYTHLDVYKRQPSGRFRFSSRSCSSSAGDFSRGCSGKWLAPARASCSRCV